MARQFCEFCSKAPRSTIAIIMSMSQACTCGRPNSNLSPSPPKQRKSDIPFKGYTPVSARLPLTKSQKKIERAQQYKSASVTGVSALTASVPCKMA